MPGEHGKSRSNKEDLKEPVVPEVVLDVNSESSRRELVSIFESVSLQSCPTMLGLLLTNKELLEKFTQQCPDFYKDASEIILDEARIHNQKEEAKIECIKKEPELINESNKFSLRGQNFAFALSLFGLTIAAYVAVQGSYKVSSLIVVASLAPGFIVSYINKKEQVKEVEKTIVPQRNKDKSQKK